MSIGPQGQLEKWPGETLVMDEEGFSDADRLMWWEVTTRLNPDFYNSMQEAALLQGIRKTPMIF
jgi:hypothetical protein